MSPSSSGKKKTAGATASENPSADVAGESCIHHWVIDPPNGAVSEGHCKTCGENKEFRNSFEYSSWYGNKAPGPKNKAPDATNSKATKGKPTG